MKNMVHKIEIMKQMLMFIHLIHGSKYTTETKQSDEAGQDRFRGVRGSWSHLFYCHQQFQFSPLSSQYNILHQSTAAAPQVPVPGPSPVTI